MRIICGTDLSEGSIPAIKAAGCIARRTPGARLWLVHVLDASTQLLDEKTLELVKAGAASRLEKQAQLTGLSEDRFSHVLVGSAADALSGFAKEKNADLLIVSSQGHSASPLYRVGGTTERLPDVAGVPLLVIRDAAPFESWARHNRALRILVGVDVTMGSEPVVHWVKQLRLAGPCDIIFAQVYDAHEESHRYGLVNRSFLERDVELERLIRRDLEARIGVVPGDGELSFRPILGLGRLGDHVLEVAENEAVDLIVTGSRHKQVFGRLTSVSSVVLHFGHTSIACIPAQTRSPLAPRELPKMERILIATDLSGLSNQAVAFGYAMLSGRVGEVFLLHVVEPPSRRYKTR